MRSLTTVLLTMTIGLVGCAKASSPADVPRPRKFRAPGADEPPASSARTRRLPQDVAGDLESSRQRTEMVEQLWLSPLGKMFRHFLFDNDPDQTATQQSHAIIDRVYSDVKMTLTRMSAMNMMIEDLLSGEEVAPVVYGRVTLFQTGLAMKQHVLQATSANEYLRFAPIIVGVSALSASPLVRRKVKLVGNDLWELARIGMLGGDAAATRQALAAHASVRDVFSKRFFRRYGKMRVLTTFSSLFSIGFVIYYVLRTGSADSVPVQNKIWVYGIQRFVQFDQI